MLAAYFATYGAVSNAAANLRGQKDDLLNHAIGGGSLGFIYGYMGKFCFVCFVSGSNCDFFFLNFKQQNHRQPDQ